MELRRVEGTRNVEFGGGRGPAIRDGHRGVNFLAFQSHVGKHGHAVVGDRQEIALPAGGESRGTEDEVGVQECYQRTGISGR